MKSYQYKYDERALFGTQLAQLKDECAAGSYSDVIFYITWTNNAKDLVEEATAVIEQYFPKNIYYGNEGSGLIYNGRLVYGLNITAYIFEEKDSKAKLLWIEKGTRYATLNSLWTYCRKEKGLRAIEMLPSLAYSNMLQIDASIPDIDENIAIFGGASVNYVNTNPNSEVIAKGHPMTTDGMAVILYYGSNLNVSCNYVLGWKGLGNYMKVTKCHDKIIDEIDGQPPHAIYEKYLDLKEDDDYDRVFPLIIEEDGIEFIRTPQKFLPDKTVRMFANIGEGALARIAYGDKNTILSSLFEEASKIAAFKPEILKAYSCTGRKIFWGDEEIHKETLPLQRIAPINGFYTGGEILRFGKKLRVLNCTLVTVSIREGDGADIEEKTFEKFEKNDKSLVSRITHFAKVVSEEQLEQKKQLEEALRMADAANRAKTEFLFNMSHDIRTPMNAILGFTNIALRHIDNKAKTVDCLKKTQQSGDLLLSLINSVLEVSRIESGNAVLDEQIGDIYCSFTNIDNTMRIMAESKDINLTFEFGTIKDRYVRCDFARCARVFVNIISNAIKYTPEGGSVTVRCDEIEGIRNGKAVYQFTFKDNGLGMSEEFQKHVFEQFARERNSTITGIQGTGLGMAVCKSFVDLMGGTISCDSKPHEGTTFVVTLPLAVIDVQSYNAMNLESLAGTADKFGYYSPKDLRGKRGLLVEDNELNREIATDILEDEGFLVESAEDGQVSLDMLKEHGPDYYDFILMDIQMPVMNGYEATKKIRKLYPDSKIPIIAVSANAFDEDKAASIAAGMDAHVAKPINIRELIGCLNRLA